jgi:hypothetical protein
MAKKNLAVSLRKPPPPADLAALVTEAAMPQVRAASRRKAPVKAPIDATPSVESMAVPETIIDSTPTEVAMPAAMDAFVVEPAPAPVEPVAAAPAPKKSPEIRGLTIELPPSVSERLLAYCTMHDRDVNEVVIEILKAHLDSLPAAEAFSLKGVLEWVRGKIRVVLAMRDRVLSHLTYFAMAR